MQTSGYNLVLSTVLLAEAQSKPYLVYSTVRENLWATAVPLQWLNVSQKGTRYLFSVKPISLYENHGRIEGIKRI